VEREVKVELEVDGHGRRCDFELMIPINHQSEE